MTVDRAQSRHRCYREFFLGLQIVVHLRKSIEWVRRLNEKPLRLSSLIGLIDVNCRRALPQHQPELKQVWLHLSVRTVRVLDFLLG